MSSIIPRVTGATGEGGIANHLFNDCGAFGVCGERVCECVLGGGKGGDTDLRRVVWGWLFQE